jgi:hypothetical protein
MGVAHLCKVPLEYEEGVPSDHIYNIFYNKFYWRGCRCGAGGDTNLICFFIWPRPNGKLIT